MRRPLSAAVIALGLGLASAGQALAWGSTGHRIIGELAAEQFTADMPGFLLTAQAKTDIGEYARELDRSKGAGKTHDAERDPGHYVDLADDGSVEGILPLDKLPTTREEYGTLLRAGGKAPTRRLATQWSTWPTY